MCWMNLYDVARNTKRWPTVILFGLMNLAGVNSHIIYCANNNTTKILGTVYSKELITSLTMDKFQSRSLITNLLPDIRRRKQEDAVTCSQAVRADQFLEITRKKCYLCRKGSKTKYHKFGYLTCVIPNLT